MSCIGFAHAQSAGAAPQTPVIMFQAKQPSAPVVRDQEAEVPLVVAPVLSITPVRVEPLAFSNSPLPVWDPANMAAVVAPPAVAGDTFQRGQSQPATTQSVRPPVRSPIKAIVQDTGIAITRDVPEAVARALPWVDRDRKNEPFEQVLGRVADELSRSSASDPAWASGAQREIRALARRLDRFPEPPPSVADQQSQMAQTDIGTIDPRPFRPRPIWPGASGRPEAQVRPNSIVTTSSEQVGLQAAGVNAQFVQDDLDGAPIAARPALTKPTRAPTNTRSRPSRQRR